MPDTLTKTEDNPYNDKARLARDAKRRSLLTQYNACVAVDRETSQLVSRACGVNVIDAPRREREYSLPVPCKSNDNERFDEAVRRDRNWLSGRNKRPERN